MRTSKHTARRVDDGWEYRGRFISRIEFHSNSYNPWKVDGMRGGFRTLADAKAAVDEKIDGKDKESRGD